MFGTLLKKEFFEIFRVYFYNEKKNKMRSRAAVAAWFIFYIAIMLLFAGIFAGVAFSMCKGLLDARLGWMYYTVMGGIAVVLGVFASVFNTYPRLYLAKDNNLLLSMPISVKDIVFSRLADAYLLGALYSGTVFIPSILIYLYYAGVSAKAVIGGIVMFLIISAIAFVLSCLLGYAVAKISVKIKKKSFVTVLASLLFFGLYYFCYFKASDVLQDVVLNAVLYGEKIKGGAYLLYMFGTIGEGHIANSLIYAGAMAIICYIVAKVMLNSFLGIVTSTGKADRVKYVEKTAKERTVFAAVLSKEFGRFTSSPNYMLSCGLGTLLIPIVGVLALVKGSSFLPVFKEMLSDRQGVFVVLIVGALCLLATMNDIATPSVSLEGKSIWIMQSMPIDPAIILRAKGMMQFILTAVPILFTTICVSIVIDATIADKILIVIVPLIFTAFSAVFNTFIAVKMPVLSWTNEIAPMKQSGGVAVSLFGPDAILIALGVLYYLLGYRIGSAPCLMFFGCLCSLVTVMIAGWLRNKGAKAYSNL